MSDKPKITTLDEAKAALDSEIIGAQEQVNHHAINAANAKGQLDRAEGILWRLKSLRRRMEPEVTHDTACAVHDAGYSELAEAEAA